MTSARARASRAASPPDSPVPRSPTGESSPAGSPATRAPSRASSTAVAMTSGAAPGRPRVRLSRSDPAKTRTSCSTIAVWRRRSASARSRMSVPSTLMLPWSGSQNRRIRLMRVLLPAPDAPTTATTSPRRRTKSSPRSTGRPGS